MRNSVVGFYGIFIQVQIYSKPNIWMFNKYKVGIIQRKMVIHGYENNSLAIDNEYSDFGHFGEQISRSSSPVYTLFCLVFFSN